MAASGLNSISVTAGEKLGTMERLLIAKPILGLFLFWVTLRIL